MKMKRMGVIGVMLMLAAGTSSARTVKEAYTVPCGTLWRAVKDTVRNSGYYAVVLLDNNEMIASFVIGTGGSMRIESAALNAKGDGCELQLQPLHRNPFAEDAADFKKRVNESLAQIQSAAPPSQGSGVK